MWAAALVLVASVALRVVYGLRLSFDTDEPQHLHVAWLWTQGLVAYRDFFDNHTPLFHLLAAPFVAAAGETPDLMLWARHAMLPIVAVLLYAVYRLGRSTFSPRVGVWAAAVTSILPSFLYDSVEFRADVLWAALWMIALAYWAAAPLTPRRGFVLGLLVGITLAASIKTVVLVSTFAAASAIVAVLARTRPSAGVVRTLLAFTIGVALVVATVLAGFWQLGMLGVAYECLIAHNASSVVLWKDRLPRIVMFVVTAPILVLAARTLLLRSTARATTRATLLLATALYYTTSNGFMPIVPTQNLLPFYPMAVLLTCGLALGAFDERPHWHPRGAALLSMVAIAEIALLWFAAPLTKDGTAFKRGVVADVLRLTGPEDTVMDLKGESLFRRRPVYAVLEHITEELMKRGEIPEDIPERMIASRTFVVVVDSPRFPPRTRSFLHENYVPVGRLRVAGKVLAPDGDGSAAFEVVVPGRYTILAPNGPAAGTLDDEELGGSRELEAGAHRFHPAAKGTPLALVWAEAAEKGYSPFQ